MRIDDPNDNTNYGDQFDGGAATDAEAALIAAGVGEDTEADGDAAGDDGAAAAAEAARIAAETVEAARVAATETVTPVVATLPEKPVAPKDFAAEELALEEQYNDAGMSVVEYTKKMKELTLEQVAYTNQVAAWEQQVQAITANNAKQVADDWDKTCVAFEAANADFLGNALRHQVMQNSIALVEDQAQKAGERLTGQQVLEKALAIAIDYTGYQAPAGKTDQQKIDEAIAARRQEKPGKTLGDVPQAHVESVRGDATFEALDSLPTEEFEIAFANLSPAAQEKYLRAAPGAEANGRG